MDALTEKTIKVSLVIADIDEYVQVENCFNGELRPLKVAGLTAHIVDFEGENSHIVLTTVCSGIGKVNAASAAALVADDCDILINAGLSGGFSDTEKYDLVLGTRFIEHDFDLTAIGYAPSVKPGNEGELLADAALCSDILSKFPFVRSGTFVTGDSFICTKEKHDQLAKLFDPIACDMESAAVAHVAAMFSKPYVSVRLISDGANDDSTENYSDTLHCDRAGSWLALVIGWLKTL